MNLDLRSILCLNSKFIIYNSRCRIIKLNVIYIIECQQVVSNILPF